MAYNLIFMQDGREVIRECEERELTIGRSPDCSLVLIQPGISRRHCRILQKDDECKIEDLNSKNGTRVNSVYVKVSKLEPGDEIMLGEYQLTFQQDQAPSVEDIEELGEEDLFENVVLSEEKGLQEEAGTIIREVNELNDIIAQYEANERLAKERKDDKSGSRQIMTVLIEVAQALIAVKSLDEIVRKVMDLIFDHLPADRGFLMLADEANPQDLRPRVVRYRDQTKEAKGQNIEISKTIAMKVFHESVAILTTDAQIDPRFKAGESIRFLGIKSAMCVPLFHKKKTIGILYLDSPTSAAVFDQNDLDLLTAMANFAAVGIEQALLTEKIGKETMIRQRLERYHSPSIVNRILKKASGAEGAAELNLSVQDREVTVLFADIVGFTPMSQRMEPTKIAHLLNDYFSEMTEAIFKFEGTLDKYIGDAIMAIFGAPNRMEDHPYQAVRAGLEMLQRLEVLNERRTEGDRFSIRIGINTGNAVAGDIGSVKRMEYTVLGNTVNVASRIESMACPPNQVVVGKDTYDRIKEHFVCENLGPIKLKGISEEMPVYRILSLKDQNTP